MRKRKGRKGLAREKPLQIMLSSEALKAIENFRFQHRMPSRSAATRELLRLGLAAVEADDNTRVKSGDYSVLNSPPETQFVEHWHDAARVVCDIIASVSELTDILQAHPEFRYDLADLEAAHQALGCIVAIMKQRAAR